VDLQAYHELRNLAVNRLDNLIDLVLHKSDGELTLSEPRNSAFEPVNSQDIIAVAAGSPPPALTTVVGSSPVL
jgi:hypothetical protein